MAFGEVFLGAFITVLFEKMASGEMLKFLRHEGIDTQLMKLSNMLSSIQAVLIDAEEKQMTDRAVNLWLDDLEDLAYDLDDVVDEFATEALRRKIMAESQASTSKVWNFIPTSCTNFKPSALMFNLKMKSKIEDITTRLRNSFEQSLELKLEKIVRKPTSGKTWQRQESTSLLCEPRIYGREQDQRKIIELLVGGDESSHKNVDVIAIVGMGGIGKTTLAQKVYNDETVQKHFDLKAWVCVSEEFDIMRITKAILESVTFQPCSLNGLDQVHIQLKHALAGKKFLIVLDDVWNKTYSAWNVLKSPFTDGAQGSKVVVTTRNRDIARMMGAVEIHDIEILSDDDCWSLFAQHAFHSRNIDENLEAVGKKIVEKCKGLPLAVRTLGGLLRCKIRDEEWLDVFHSKIWDLPQDESDILPALRLSYHHLSPQLKQCFAYCSIIPNDYEFEEEELVFLWMAEGFIQQQSEKQMEDVGGEYFRELLSRSFFQPSSTGKSSKFVMHDLINELAQAVARDTCFRLVDNLKDQKLYKNLKKARHSSCMQEYYDGMKKFEIFYKAVHLRTLLPFDLQNFGGGFNLATNVPINLLPKLRCLRVLNMSKYLISELPNSIGDLKHLRYLNLSETHIKELPESLGSLYNLQTLLLRECEKLKQLPADMGNLIELRHLDITGANSFEEMPVGIGKLTSLQTLSNFIVNKHNRLRIRELGNLIYLRGKLCLSGLQNVMDLLDAKGANLKDKQGLDVLSLEWSASSDDSRDGRVETEVLEMLRPHKNLKELHIKCYLGTEFPTWLGELSKMVCISLQNCENCVFLPPLGQLPLLKDLCIKGMSALKHVGREFYGQGSAKPFPLLETLSFENMPEWEDWYTFGDHKEVQQPFTCVNKLSIKKCPKLVGILPSDLLCLKNLEITECPQLLLEASSLVLPSLTSLVMKNVPFRRLQLVLDMRNMGDDEVMLENAMSNHSSLVTSLSIENIQKLEFLPKWFTRGLMELAALKITRCEELKTLWKNETRLQHSLLAFRLCHLEINSCPQLVSLFEEDEDEENEWQHQQQQQEGLPCIVRLEHLDIRNCEKLEKLPQKLHTFSFLRELHVCGCPSFGSFPNTGFPSTLRSLEVRDCKALESLFRWITQINDNNLERLAVEDCPSLTCLISCRGGLPPTFEWLMIRGCEKLETLLVEEGMKINCPYLSIYGCDGLKYLPDALPNNNSNLRNPRKLHVMQCGNLESIPEGWFHSATNLTELNITGCKKLKALQPLPHRLQTINYLTSLQSLQMNIPHWNNNFKEIGLHSLSSLTSLSIYGRFRMAEEEEDLAGSIFPIDGTLLPTFLKSLGIWNFPNLKKLSSTVFQNLTSLESLQIISCPKLESFPMRRLPPSLNSLLIGGSPKLERKCEKERGKYWHLIAHIPNVEVFGLNWRETPTKRLEVKLPAFQVKDGHV